ncbi:MAG: hypothetical protein A2556_01030 [Candidatus Vogelbacteria bacterium RIFOXYD2_FULL_44_9]|uniref:Uncharacterized protein n=1 Tax=Candidatus Vogelbacteria bacterium RIFOXYD2_FULL_44_9 TaxID=1802441 RepID=A0A1G2QNI7_9BACT|nr:MAG: hypothetical protein A2556_01030 [Candidatus Vogelbacteria bacterium RIFOXYD2_FULL_44_9]
MHESFNSFENSPVSEQEVVKILNSKGLEDNEARELLVRYVDQCHVEADTEASADPESSITSNRANIKAEIKIAILYSKTENYRDLAISSLEEALMAAVQDPSTQDLAEQIKGLF